MPRKSTPKNPFTAARKFRRRLHQAQQLVDLWERSGQKPAELKPVVDEARTILDGERVRSRPKGRRPRMPPRTNPAKSR